MIALVFAGLVFFRISTGHDYEYLPTPADWEVFRQECQKAFQDAPDSEKYMADWIALTMKKEILKNFAHCTSVNAVINTERSSANLTVNRALMVAVSASLLAVVVFTLADLKESPIYRAQMQMVPYHLLPKNVELANGLRIGILTVPPKDTYNWRDENVQSK